MPVQRVAERALDLPVPSRCHGTNPLTEQCLWYDVNVIEIDDRRTRKTLVLSQRNFLRDAADCRGDLRNEDLVQVCVARSPRQQKDGAAADWTWQIRPHDIELLHDRVRFRRDFGRGSHTTGLM